MSPGTPEAGVGLTAAIGQNQPVLSGAQVNFGSSVGANLRSSVVDTSNRMSINADPNMRMSVGGGIGGQAMNVGGAKVDVGMGGVQVDQSPSLKNVAP